MSRWSGIVLILAGAAISSAAGARDYKLGCAGDTCVIVDDTGRISRFDVADKKVADGVDQLKVPEADRIRPPLNIACNATPDGGTCVVTDADGHVWTAPARAGAAFGEPVAKLPIPGPR